MLKTPLLDRVPIQCPELPPLLVLSLESLARAFKAAPVCVLRQAWLENAETDFAAGEVRVGWQGDNLLVYAELTDADIFTRAKAPNQRLWELGDSFEIFLRPWIQEAYREFQIAPNNQRLQLRFAGWQHFEAVQEVGQIDSCTLPDGVFDSHTWVRPDLGKWFAFARVPASVVFEEPAALADSRWLFSFGRYDYTRGRRQPVISSTSPHTKPNFHRQEEWGLITFESSRPAATRQLSARL